MRLLVMMISSLSFSFSCFSSDLTPISTYVYRTQFPPSNLLVPQSFLSAHASEDKMDCSYDFPLHHRSPLVFWHNDEYDAYCRPVESIRLPSQQHTWSHFLRVSTSHAAFPRSWSVQMLRRSLIKELKVHSAAFSTRKRSRSMPLGMLSSLAFHKRVQEDDDRPHFFNTEGIRVSVH